MKLFIVICTTLLLFFSCNDDEKISQIYSYPEWQKDVFLDKLPSGGFYLFQISRPSQGLFSTKELKGPQLPKAIPNEMSVGGHTILLNYLKILKERLGEKVLILGESDLDLSQKDQSRNKMVLDALNLYPLDGILLSKGELPKKAEQAKDLYKGLPWFNSNILSITSGDPTDIYQNEPYKVFSQFQFSLLGVTSYQNLSSQERNEISGFYFQDPVTTILRYKNPLSQKNKSLLALYYKGPLECQQKFPITAIPFKELPQFSEVCSKNSELENILKRLPPQAIGLVITSHPNLAGTLFKGIPVIGAGGAPTYLSGIRLVQEGAQLNHKKSFLLPPVKLCHKMFAGTQDCVFNTQNEDVDDERFELIENKGFGLIPARFLGREISP